MMKVVMRVKRVFHLQTQYQYITKEEVHLICNLTLDPVAAIDAHLHDIFHLSPLLHLVRFPNPLPKVRRGPCLLPPHSHQGGGGGGVGRISGASLKNYD